MCVPVCLSCLHRYLKLSIFFTLLLSFSPFLFRVLLFAVPSFASWPLRCLHLNRFSDQNFHHFHFLCITSIQGLRLAIRYLSSHSLPFTLCSFHVHEEYLYLVWRQSSFFFRATGTWSSSLSRLLFPGNGHSHTCTHFMCVCVLLNKNVICGLRCRCPSYTDSSRSCPLHMKLSLHYTFFYGSNRTIVNGMTNGPYKRFNSSRSENHHTVRKWIAPTRLIYSL